MTELVVKAGPGDAAQSIAGFAGLLVEYERSLSADSPDSVLLADASDTALAAALVAAKLLIPVKATAEARDAPTINARLIAQLAGG